MKVEPLKNVPKKKLFSTLLEKDQPVLIIENGAYSDWQYNRINVIQLNCFLMETLIVIFSLFYFEIRKSNNEELQKYNQYLLLIIMSTTALKIISLYFKNIAELDFFKSKLFENWYTPFYKSKFIWLFIKESLFSLLVPSTFISEYKISYTYKESGDFFLINYSVNDIMTIFSIFRFVFSLSYLDKNFIYNSNASY